jgi:hypothetical protein
VARVARVRPIQYKHDKPDIAGNVSNGPHFGPLAFPYPAIRPAGQTPAAGYAIPRMEAIKRMPREVLLEFLKLLAGYERRELERVMQAWREAERLGRLH